MHYKDIIKFWFEEIPSEFWFKKDNDFDRQIKNRFLLTYEAARIGALDDWKETALGTLALIITLDQFPRNMFRGNANSHATDGLALELTKEAMAKTFDQEFNDMQKKFMYMPLMHSENIVDQDLSVKCFSFDEMSKSYAKDHRGVIIKFGRFPHRNEILGRESTKEEIEFLKTHSGY